MADTPEALVRQFWQMGPERVTDATELWIAAEQGDRGSLPPLRRLMHTIKGEAHMLGLASCALLFERAEQVVDAVMERGTFSEGVGDALLGALDLYAVLGASEGASDDETIEAVSAQLAAARDELSGAEGDAPATTTGPAERETARERAPASGAQLVAVGELQPLVLELRRLEGERALIGPQMRDALRALGSPDITEHLPTDAKRKLAHVVRRLTDALADSDTSEFTSGIMLELIEQMIQRASVVALSKLEGQIHRTARRLAQTLGKKVDVRVRGDAMLDASIERRLTAALVHLIRNALDHGIEAPEARVAAGKSERGRVDVTFAQAKSTVRVVVEDDGGGIDFDKLRARLAVTRPDAMTLSEAQLLSTLFEHGVTTREEANEISGRGVGLDVVAHEVAAIGGRVSMESTPGTGTRFVLVMPATLRLEVAMPVTAGGLRCALPARSVPSILRVSELEQTSEGPFLRAAVQGEERAVRVVSLASLLGREGRAPRVGDPVLVVDHPAGAFAVTVEGYESPRPIAAQSANQLVFDAPLIRAVAPTPDGGVLLVLDVLALRDVLHGGVGRAGTIAPAPRRQSHVLVAEDSPVARALLCGVLEALGLRVSPAEDGSVALDIALRDRPDVVLTDIEMPVLDGLSMVARMRQEPALSEVPVLVLSDRTDERTRRRAEALGVRGFLAKHRFVEADLREALAEVLPGRS